MGEAHESLSAFRQRAKEVGRITAYEASGDGSVYAVYENGEVLPIGVVLPSLAGQSRITLAAFDHAVREAVGE
jgi:flagellar hook protein FlgE